MSRPDRLAAALPEHGVDVLLVTDLTNVRYLTGYTGTNGLAVVGPDTRRFLTDFRYVEQVKTQVTEFDRVTGERDLVGDVQDLLPAGPLRVGFEAEHMSVARRDRLREVLDDRVELVPTRGVAEALRRVKDDGELEAIRAAARIADGAFTAAIAGGVVGRTEREVAWALEREIRERGADLVSFQPIVAAAGNGARPHAVPRDVPIPRDTLLVIDWGAQLDGYCSDCTRTLATGALDEDAAAAYALVERAQLVGLEGVAPGRGGREIDSLSRDIIAGAGHGEHYGHGLGHGVGLEVHEAPTLSQRSEDTLAPGNVVTVEPGVYVPNRFGVRIEDLVVVTESGHEVLSSLPKRLTVVD
ncbi:MAG: peptidase [Solirubrobacterales bacterium]|nr:peptidase [Solirubrobacterales bacterium]